MFYQNNTYVVLLRGSVSCSYQLEEIVFLLDRTENRKIANIYFLQSLNLENFCSVSNRLKLVRELLDYHQTLV